MSQTLIPWPAELPAPLQRGYGYTRADNRVRTQMASGAPKTRRTGAVGMDEIRCTLSLSFGQLALFEHWYQQTLLDGAQWVAMPLHSGTGIDTYAVQFDKINQRNHRGNRYELSFTVITSTRPEQALTAQQVAVLASN